MPFSFAGTNLIIAIEDVLVSGQSATVIDDARLRVAYRHGRLAEIGGASVTIKVSTDGHSAMLCIPGKAPWRVTSKNKVAVLQRLVEAYATGTAHVNTKKLMDGTNYPSPSNLFTKSSPWRNYVARVTGAQAWQLRLPSLDEVIEEDSLDLEAKEEALTD